MVCEHQEEVLIGVDDGEGVLSDLSHDRDKRASVSDRTDKEAISTLARITCVEDFVLAVIRHIDGQRAVRVRGVFVDKLIGVLGCPNLMKIDLLVDILCCQLGASGRLWIACVVKAIIV